MGVNTQGLMIYVKDEASADYLKIGCLQSLGDLSLGTRSAKEDGCMDKEVMGKVIGALKYGSLDITYKYDPTEPLGHGQLGVAHKANPAPIQDFRIELPNIVTTGTGNGTQFDFKVYVTERSISFPKDDDMEAKAKLEMINEPTVTAAA